MLLHDWIGSKSNLVHTGKELGKLDCWIYLGSYLSSGGRKSDEMSSGVKMAWLEWIETRHPWYRGDIHLSEKTHFTQRYQSDRSCCTVQWGRIVCTDCRCSKTVVFKALIKYVMVIVSEIQRLIVGYEEHLGLMLKKYVKHTTRLIWLGQCLCMPTERPPRLPCCLLQVVFAWYAMEITRWNQLIELFRSS